MITAKLREEVIWSGPCAYCGDEAPDQVDHILPRSRGGTDDRSNLAPACKWCNMEKLDFTPEEYRQYREEKGLGWPPQSRLDFIAQTVREAMIRYNLTHEDLRRIAQRMRKQAALERLPEW